MRPSLFTHFRVVIVLVMALFFIPAVLFSQSQDTTFQTKSLPWWKADVLFAVNKPIESDYEKTKFRELLDQTVRLNVVALKLLRQSHLNGSCHESYRMPLFVLGGNISLKSVYPDAQSGDWIIGGVLDPSGIMGKAIVPGDRIIKINGVDVPTFSEAENDKRLYSLSNSMTVTVQRGNDIWDVSLPTHKIFCDLNFYVYVSKEMNASASRPNNVLFTTTMMGYLAKNDDQLAFILAHEISHHDKGHTKLFGIKNMAKGAFKLFTEVGTAVLLNQLAQSDPALRSSLSPDKAALAGQLVGGVVAAPFNKHQESAADAEAMIVLKQSGFDLKNGAGILRRMAWQFEYMNQYSLTHPPSWQRYKDVMAGEGVVIDIDQEKANLAKEAKAQNEKFQNVIKQANKKYNPHSDSLTRAQKLDRLRDLVRLQDVYVDKDLNILSPDEYEAIKIRKQAWDRVKNGMTLDAFKEILGDPVSSMDMEGGGATMRWTMWMYADGKVQTNEKNQAIWVYPNAPARKILKGSKLNN